jgi:hypothetical protein
MIILNTSYINGVECCGLDGYGLGQGLITESCGQGNEPTGFIKGEECSGLLSNY